MNKTTAMLLSALALGMVAPSMASAQPVAHKTTTVIQNGHGKTVVKKTVVKKKVTCRYEVRNHRKVKVCR